MSTLLVSAGVIGVVSYVGSERCARWLLDKSERLEEAYNKHMTELFERRLKATPGHGVSSSPDGDYTQLGGGVKEYFCTGTGAAHLGCVALKKEFDEAYTQFFKNDRPTYRIFGTIHKAVIVVITIFAAIATKSFCPTAPGMPFFVKAGSVCLGGLLFGALPAMVAGVTHSRILSDNHFG